MLSDQGREALDYQLDKADEIVYHLSNLVDEINIDGKSADKINAEIDNLIQQLLKLKQSLNYY